jgi:4-amino-4-deoxy-L-arabinose transferase-like glycosyltransferase
MISRGKYQSTFDQVSALLTERSWITFTALALLVVLIRWATFYQSELDWDESLYVLVAQDWLKGNPPYTKVWDNKPPGIYALFAATLATIGRSMLSIRMLACVFISITCFFLYKIGALLEKNGKKVGFLAGTFYAIVTVTSGGDAANTELFFATFVVIAFYLFFVSKFHLTFNLDANILRRFFFVGLLLGLGFQVKYVALFDCVALAGIFLLSWLLQNRLKDGYWSIASAVSITILGFIVPTMVVVLYFLWVGHFGDYAYANFTANKLRTVSVGFSLGPPLRAIARQTLYNPVFWVSVPVVLLHLRSVRDTSFKDKRLVMSWLIWFFVVLFSIVFTLRGFLYNHYFLHLAPANSLLTAYIIIHFLFASGGKSWPSSLKISAILGLILTVLITTQAVNQLFLSAQHIYFRHFKGEQYWKDTQAETAAYLMDRIKPEDYIYTVNGFPIVYFLTNAKIPTRYAFPPFLVSRPDLPNITGVDALQELDRIFEKKPTYILVRQDEQEFDRNKPFFDKLNQVLATDYRLDHTVKPPAPETPVNLYRRNLMSALPMASTP